MDSTPRLRLPNPALPTYNTTLYDDLAFYDGYGNRLSDLYYWTNEPYEPLDSVGYRGQWGYYTDPEMARNVQTADYSVRSPLMLLGYRYYDPASARFLTRDPIGYNGGINVYAYCENNPVNHIDPSGLTEGWDLVFLAWDVFNVVADIVTDAPPAVRALDATALGIDGALTLIPGAPAGPGHLLMAGAKTTALAAHVVPKVPAAIRIGQTAVHTASTASKLGIKPPRSQAPKQPNQRVAEHGEVTFESYFGSQLGDHLPVHIHVEGGGRGTRILPGGKPFPGDAPMTRAQLNAYFANAQIIRKRFNEIGRWIDHQTPGKMRGGGPGTGRKMSY